jgi:HSP20 family protein
MGVKDLIPRFGSRPPALRSDSAHPLFTLHEEMNRLFDGFWRELGADGFWPTQSSFGFPRVEVTETDREVRVEADLPGLDEKDVELLLADNVLTIRGEKKSETQDKSRRVSERFYGRFERQIALPVDVQEDKISASFQKGVLTITLPKSALAAQKVKRIPINDL